MDYVLIGCGRIAVNHLRAAAANHLNILAVCDINPRNAENLLEKAGLSEHRIPVYTDYRVMLDQTCPALAAVATPSGSHAAIALECIARGIPAIVEKPVALSMADADELVRRSSASGIPVCTCHQNRFNEAVVHLRGALESGRFGELSHAGVCVRWNRNRAYYEQSPWRGTWAQDGGALMNQSIHGIDLLSWMLGGNAREVMGMTRRAQHDYLEAEDAGLALIRFGSGVIASVEGTVNAYGGNLEETLTLFGERGLARLCGTSANQIGVWRFDDERAGDEAARGLLEQTENVYGNGHRLLYADMIDALKQKRAPNIDARAGRNALELVLAIYKSQLTGQPVPLPLEGFSTMDMARSLKGGRL
ncbi:MAG: Gfo/Idh/MocA family oxidoreductase [Clostridiaceae bacterium]